MSGTRTPFSLGCAAPSHWQRVKSKLLFAISVSAALCASCSVAAQPAPPRQPVGIYAIPNIDGCVAETNHTDECISNNIADLLTNSAISGIALFVRWSDLNPSYPPGSTDSTNGYYDWSILDDVFGAVQKWNLQHPTNHPATIQLGIIPGFWTSPWVLHNLINCDPMFLTNSDGTILGVVPTNVPTNCGCATFLNSEGAENSLMLLPLPWNSLYTNAWGVFIQAVAQKYGTNPLLVSVSVPGPSASSEEMILPNEKNDTTNWLKWNPLIALEFPEDPSYTNSDTVFIQAWENAIDLFGNAFSNLTLTISTGSGLPNFLMPVSKLPYTNNYSVPPGFCADCADTNSDAPKHIMDCAAETTILAYFADPQHGGNNAKATQENGLGANGIFLNPLGPADLDSYGIKWLASSTSNTLAQLPGTGSAVSRVLAGLQFKDAFSVNPQAEGCNESGGCTNYISPEQAFYNVLQVYFDGTSVGGAYGVTPGDLSLNYMQVWYSDVFYANTKPTGSAVGDGSGATTNMTAHNEFEEASSRLIEIAEPPVPLPAALALQTVSNVLQITWPASAGAYQLQVNSDLSHPERWKTNSDTPILTNSSYEVSITPSKGAAFYRLAAP
jgi:hypothetical protein